MSGASLALNTPGQAEFSVARSYGKRGWIDSEIDIDPGGTVYSYALTHSGSGNVTGAADSVMGSWTYGYDRLNRLVTGTSTTGPFPNLSIAWTYDAFGNRETQLGTPGGEVDRTALSYTGNSYVNGALPANAPVYNNRMDDSNYDGAGDLIDDGSQSYIFDAEGRVCARKNDWASDMNDFVYDGLGRRISEGTITSFSCDMTQNGYHAERVYAVGLDGQVLDVGNGSGDGQAQPMNVYTAAIGGRLLASFGAAHWYYAFNDWVGTKRVTALEDGTPAASYPSLPFGGYQSQTGGPDISQIHFTGHPTDVYTSNEYFGARTYRDSINRFLTPDPSGLTYADITNPQSFNLYGYALNNPLTFVDPTGMYCFYGGNGDTVANDSDPSDYDFTSDSPSECNDTGGSWIDNPSTTVTVNGNTGAVGWTSTFPTAISSSTESSESPSSNATNKGFQNNQQIRQCLNSYYNSTAGKFIDFFSVGGLVPGWSPNAGHNFKELATLGAVKFIGLVGLEKLGNAVDTMTIQSIAGNSVTIGSSGSAGIATGLKFLGKVGTVATVGATTADILAHYTCTVSAYPTPSVASPF